MPPQRIRGSPLSTHLSGLVVDERHSVSRRARPRWLVAVDGSQHGDAALAWASAHAAGAHAHLTVFCVSEDLADRPSMYALRTDAARILQLALDDHARDVVEQAPAPPGVRVSRRWTRGHPASAILEELAAQSYDLVVLGALGHTASSRRFGGVARQVLRGADVPVMVVPAKPLEMAA